MTSYLQIALEAFGKRFELELNRNLNLLPQKRRLNVFFADRGKEDIHYGPAYDEVRLTPQMLFNITVRDSET